ncbi:MAG TPA: hypothetical protein VKT82_08680 [Ktedonobacterales bacterium]|nr:hypothetical protein [Ktedonobacterales bacterium]
MQSHMVTLYVGAECRTLAWTPELDAQWATVARLALPVVEVTPTPVPMIWVDGARQSGLEDLIRLALHTSTWEATSLWLTLLTADGQLAETVLRLSVSRPMVYPLVLHFQLKHHRSLLTHLASGGLFHLALESTGLVIPSISVGTAGLTEQLAATAALSQDTRETPKL